jgi:hypothetical protein
MTARTFVRGVSDPSLFQGSEDGIQLFSFDIGGRPGDNMTGDAPQDVGLMLINKCPSRQVGLVGRRCSAAEAARQRGPTVYPVSVL